MELGFPCNFLKIDAYAISAFMWVIYAHHNICNICSVDAYAISVVIYRGAFNICTIM